MIRALLLGAACLAGASAARAAPHPDLVIGVASFPSTLHPSFDPDVIKFYVLGFVDHPVTAWDPAWHLGCLLCTRVPTLANGDAVLEKQPDGSQGMAVTFHFKPGLQWGDGAPLGAADLAFTARIGRDPNSGFANTKTWEKVSRVDVVDPQTAIVHFSEPDYQYNTLGEILPAHLEAPVFDHAAGPGAYMQQSLYNRTPLNPGLYNGPYVITGYDLGSQIVLEPNPHWAGAAPHFRRIVIKTIGNTAALQANLQSGDVDMVPGEGVGLTFDQVLTLQRQQPDRFTYAYKPNLTYQHIDLNLSNPILADVRVRRALLLGMDRQGIADKLLGGRVPVADSFVSPLEDIYTKQGVPTYPFDPARARALLAEAGWRPGADGICRNAAGQRLSIEFSTTAGVRARELQQQILQSDWRKIGVETIIKNEPPRTLFGETLRHRSLHRDGDVLLELVDRKLAAPGAEQRADPDRRQQLGRHQLHRLPRRPDGCRYRRRGARIGPGEAPRALGRHAAHLRRATARAAHAVRVGGACLAALAEGRRADRPQPTLHPARRRLARRMTDVLSVTGLGVGFPSAGGAMRQVVAGIGYTVAAGRTLGVVGESGCGKSMTALAVMGLVPSPGRVTGSIQVEGREMLGQPGEVWRQLRGARVAMVFQEPMTALNPVMRVGRQIAEVMVLHQGLGWRDAEARAVQMLDKVGINSPKQRAASYPHQLSGGMRQRAMIAMALACRPKLLIADEPTTALDVTIQAQILDLMQTMQDEIGMAIQFISHNLAVISEIAHEIIVMYAGRVVERAAADALFADPLHPYTLGLIATLPNPAHRAELLPVIPGGVPNLDGGFTGCRFADRCRRGDAVLPRRRAAFGELAPGHFVACFKAANDMTPLIELDGLRVHFPVGRGRAARVEDVSLTIAPGETLALVGESGSGKSTLGNVVAGLQKPTAGVMRFRGSRSARRPASRRSARSRSCSRTRSARWTRGCRCRPSSPSRCASRGSAPRNERQMRAAVLVQQVGLPRDALNRYPHEFSGGQRQRIAIARALAPEPVLIVADEPLSALDVSIQSQILNLMRALQQERGLAYLFISHDLAVVNHLADRVAVLYLGRLVEVASRADAVRPRRRTHTPRRCSRRSPASAAAATARRRSRGEMPSPLSAAAGLRLPPPLPKGPSHLPHRPAHVGPRSGPPRSTCRMSFQGMTRSSGIDHQDVM